MARQHDQPAEPIDEALTEAVEADATEAEVQIEALTNDLKRAQADFVNYRRRSEAEKADLLSLAKTRVVRDFLAVRDTFDQELAHRPGDVDPAWAASIDRIRDQFDAVLKRLGATRYASLGEPFDPHRHNAVAVDESGEASGQEIVVEELQPGYQLGELVLRPAMVRVGRSGDAQVSNHKED